MPSAVATGPADGSASWLPLAEVTDRTDGKLAHLDGLHLSRAWALRGMVTSLPGDDPPMAAIESALAKGGLESTKGGLESTEYRGARDSVQALTRAAVDGLLAEHHVDLLVLPTNAVPFSIDLVHGDSWYGGSGGMAAIAGYPHVTVPMGQVKKLPVGLSFIGSAFSEPVLIRAAHAYEQATRHTTTRADDDPWGLDGL